MDIEFNKSPVSYTHLDVYKRQTHASDLSQNGFISINADVVEFVKQMDKDKNIWIIGGNTILRPLLNNNMVDHIITGSYTHLDV